MKARYVNLPEECLVPCLHGKNLELWPIRRGKELEIDAHAWADEVIDARCTGPFFQVLGVPLTEDGLYKVRCIHIIELDESALDAEVEQTAETLKCVRG